MKTKIYSKKIVAVTLYWLNNKTFVIVSYIKESILKIETNYILMKNQMSGPKSGSLNFLLNLEDMSIP